MIWAVVSTLVLAVLVIAMIAWCRAEDRIEREYQAGLAVANARYLAAMTAIGDEARQQALRDIGDEGNRHE